MTRLFEGEEFEDRRKRFLAFLSAVARLARVVAVNVAHHVTQRGNARQFILAVDATCLTTRLDHRLLELR